MIANKIPNDKQIFAHINATWNLQLAPPLWPMNPKPIKYKPYEAFDSIFFIWLPGQYTIKFRIMVRLHTFCSKSLYDGSTSSDESKE